jgi:hypothetical protein
MEPRTDEKRELGFWQKINTNLKRFVESMKAESVAANPSNPVDCCNPPVTDKMKKKTGSPSH